MKKLWKKSTGRKIVFDKVAYGDLRQYISIGFADDPELYSKIHVSPGDFEHCVDHTYTTIQQVHNQNGCFYRIKWENEYVGFVVAIFDPMPMMPSFGINIHYRKREVLISFIRELRKLFGNKTYFVAVWDKNYRARNFFKRNGFEESYSDVKDQVLKDNKIIFLWESSYQQR